MPFIKEKRQGNIKTLICEYKSREDAMKDKCLLCETIFEVHDINNYIKHIQDWNESQERISSGKTFEKIESVQINGFINYNLISEKSKTIISKAIETNNESDWMLCLLQHNEEKWSAKEYCCSGEIEYFKTQIQKLMANGLGF